MSKRCLCQRPGEQVRILLVCGGKWHDFQHARLELLTLFAQHDLAHVTVTETYPESLEGVDVLVTYTCAVVPNEASQHELVNFVTRGGRWLALHATNAAIEHAPEESEYTWITPRTFGDVAPLLGSQFLGHPPIEPYLVEVMQPDHPLVKNIENFTVTDELYVSELFEPINVILATYFEGRSPSFTEGHSPVGQHHPVLYERQTGEGTVLYFTLGHCRGRFDVQDLGVDDLGVIDRGSWESAEYRTIVQRTISWAVHGTYDRYEYVDTNEGVTNDERA